jgi:C-terminal processing protease CtpA/Prc
MSSILLVSFSANSQTSSTTTRIKNFIKAWGFLKYHHPLVATGTLNWDSVFVHHVDGIIGVRSSNEYNARILDMINSPGQPPKARQQKKFDSLFLENKTNITWITSASTFNKEVRTKLKYIYDNKNQDTNRYIKIEHSTANFSGENKFENLQFPDTEHRLLFLSRFWNIINYFAPYKYLTTNWDGVLETFIPKIIDSKDTLTYYKTLQELSKSLNDGHSQLALNNQMLSDLFFGNYTVPFYCQIINGQVVIRNVGSDSIARALNIKQGDIILKVNGEEVGTIMTDRRKYISASNKADEDHQLSHYILDGQTSAAVLEIQRDNKIFETSVTRVSTQNRDWGAFINFSQNDVGYKKLNDSVLLIYAMQIWDGNLDTIKRLIKQSKAVIFDVRNYPRNDAFFFIADPFLSEPKTIDYATVALPELPGLFKWKLNPNKIGHVSDTAYQGKVIILCDERTQSQGEYSCMVLQTIPGSVTIGSQTAGADGIVTNIPMGGGLTISYSGYGVYYPDKTQTQRVGIKIDIPVKKTVDAIKNNRDEILDRALQYID